VANPVNAVQSTVADTPMRSSTSSAALAMMSQRISPFMGTTSSSGTW
jgi:hypothetical protein